MKFYVHSDWIVDDIKSKFMNDNLFRKGYYLKKDIKKWLKERKINKKFQIEYRTNIDDIRNKGYFGNIWKDQNDNTLLYFIFYLEIPENHSILFKLTYG